LTLEKPTSLTWPNNSDICVVDEIEPAVLVMEID
jgi:hypothetical protein